MPERASKHLALIHKRERIQICIAQVRGILIVVGESPDVPEQHADALNAAADLLERLGAELGIERYRSDMIDPAANTH